MYRSLYSMINYKLLARDLDALQRQYADEFKEEISDYTILFADAYCNEMKANFASQMKGVDTFLAEESPQF